ncbi:MAG: hypothetical protein E7585_00395 [Ruminococcaceae bacterium]|nr:hypothetical protein [Oscillospiraceae bacterium]
MKFLIALKTIFITGTLAMLAGGVFVVINQLVSPIFHPALLTALIVFGSIGIFCGIGWYNLKEKKKAAKIEEETIEKQ